MISQKQRKRALNKGLKKVLYSIVVTLYLGCGQLDRNVDQKVWTFNKVEVRVAPTIEEADILELNATIRYERKIPKIFEQIDYSVQDSIYCIDKAAQNASKKNICKHVVVGESIVEISEIDAISMYNYTIKGDRLIVSPIINNDDFMVYYTFIKQ